MELIYIANTDATEAYPHTANKPKSLLKVLGHTAIEHNLSQAAKFCSRIIVAVGFKAAMIKQRLGESFEGKPVIYVDVMPNACETEIIKACRGYIKKDFIMMNDNGLYSGIDIKNCIDAGQAMLICDNGRCGLYSFVFEDVQEIISKGFTAAVSQVKPLGIKDYYLPLVYPWHILEANVFLLRRFDGFANHGTVEPNVTIKGDVYIGHGTTIKGFCYIEGPAFIDDNCLIGPFAYIRKDSIIGKGVQVGRMEMFDVVIMDGFTSKHTSYAGHSVIGEKGNFGAGTITSDYRHDGGTHTTLINGKKVDTGRRKLGAFLGDNVNTGIGTLLYPGRKIWPGGSTLPGEVVKADKM